MTIDDKNFSFPFVSTRLGHFAFANVACVLANGCKRKRTHAKTV